MDHTHSPIGRTLRRISRICLFAQDVTESASDRKELLSKIQRFIVLEIVDNNSKDPFFKILVEERWVEYFDNSHPRYHSVVLQEFSLKNRLNQTDRLLLKTLETAQSDTAFDIFGYVLDKIVMDPEIEEHFKGSDPGFLETWVPEYFRYHINLVLQEREYQVKTVQEA